MGCAPLRSVLVVTVAVPHLITTLLSLAGLGVENRLTGTHVAVGGIGSLRANCGSAHLH